MAGKRGWRREGSPRHFRYVDSGGRRVTDEAQLERIRALAIPPAWQDVWIASALGRSCRRPGTTRRDGSSTSTTPRTALDRSRRNTTS